MSLPERRDNPAKSEREQIGDRVAQGRAIAGRMNQAALAAAMTLKTGRRWTRSKVSDIERGEAPLHAEDLKAVAQIQGLSYAWYLDGNSESPIIHAVSTFRRPKDTRPNNRLVLRVA